jgi:DNA-binding transcriptional regulator LsrR (DeoR family)
MSAADIGFGDPHADIHRAIIAQRGKAAVHFRRRALRPGARIGIGWPDAVVPVGQIERDAHVINRGSCPSCSSTGTCPVGEKARNSS